MNNNATNGLINIIPNNYMVDVSTINSLDNTQNSDFAMNNGEIVLFQSSDGALHTISLTPEQITKLGLQVQYPTSLSNIEELNLNAAETQEPDNIMIEAPIIETNEILPQRIVYNEPAVEVPLESAPLHRIVRVSELATRGRGFQLITDHFGKETQPKIAENSLIRPRPNPSQRNNGNINKTNVFIPSISTANGSNGNDPDSVFTGKFILTHNDIGSFKPDLKSGLSNPKSILLPKKQDNKFCLKTAKLVSVQSKPTITTTGTQKTPTRNIKRGIQLKAITPQLKKTLNIKLPLTPIPTVPKPPRKIFIPEDPNHLLGWNSTQPHQTVHVLQTGDQYQSVERLNGEQLRVVTDALSNVVARPENKGNVLYDPSSKTRIVYRVVYPEDLDLYGTGLPGEENKKPKKDKKPKPAPPPIPQTPQVTRSGRLVRLPRHMTMDYERPEDDGELVREEEGSSSVSDPPNGSALGREGEETPDRRRRQGYGVPYVPVSTHKRRFTCPLCRKIYRGANRMARHFFMFPDHAITPKATEILAKYKSENEAKEIKPKLARKPNILPAETQNGIPSHADGLKLKSEESNAISHDLSCKEERSLFTSLVGILERTSDECRAAVFVRQLAALIIKLRRLMPCLLFEDKRNSSCIINEPVGKMLDVSPGKYRLNMEAIKCLGEQSDGCTHITRKQTASSTSINSSNEVNWITNKSDAQSEPTSQMEESARKNSLDKWTTNVGKRKWIPIGSQNNDDNDTSSANNDNWLTSNPESMTDNASFTQTVSDLKSWDSNLQKQSRVSESTPGSPWRANIAELAKMDIPEQLPPQRHIIEPSNQPMQSDDSISFDCSTSKIDMHSSLVFDTNNIHLKNDLSRNGPSTCEEVVGSGNYDFNDSRFDMQIDSDKLNFTSAQYNEMKYGRDALPPFRKIEPSKNLQMPVDSLSDVSSDGEKLHLPTSNGILNESSYQMTSESLGLSMENTLSADVCKSVPCNPNENVTHCNGQSMLNGSSLNIPISRADTLSRNESILSVSESSLDGERLNLSSSQSVLHLLDPLETDCLSFTDSELRPTSQMSLVDLFPFHHP